MLLKNCKLVDREGTWDVLVKDEKVVNIDREINEVGVEVIDISGKYLLPGMIDVHTHMREPGFTQKEGFLTGSKACAKGGITTFVDMPNTNPATIDVEALELKRELAKKSAIVDYGFHFGGSVTNNKEEILKAKGVLGTKVFLNVSTGKMLVEEDTTLDDIFEASRIVMVHAEGEMVQKAIDFAVKHNKKLVIAHISSKEELDMVRKAKEIYKDIYVEVTPHHLFLNDTYATNQMFRMKPELKPESDRLAMWEGIKDGTINTIGTDHAPHLVEEKMSKITFGIPGVEWALSLMLNEVNKGNITLEKVVEMYSTKPASIFGLVGKGRVEVGYDADFAVVDMDKNHVIKEEETVSKCAWSPYKGFEIKGQVEKTIVRGTVVFENGEFYNNQGKEVKIDG